jgi:hypothetical protein
MAKPVQKSLKDRWEETVIWGSARTDR